MQILKSFVEFVQSPRDTYVHASGLSGVHDVNVTKYLRSIFTDLSTALSQRFHGKRILFEQTNEPLEVVTKVKHISNY